MNRQKLVNGLDLDDKRILDQEVNDVSLRDRLSFVLQGYSDLPVIWDCSKLQLAAQAGMIAGFQEPWPEMPMDLDGGSDDLVTDCVGRMLDESHGPGPSR